MSGADFFLPLPPAQSGGRASEFDRAVALQRRATLHRLIVIDDLYNDTAEPWSEAKRVTAWFFYMTRRPWTLNVHGERDNRIWTWMTRQEEADMLEAQRRSWARQDKD